MSAGTIFGKVVLDRPEKWHCGPNDPVKGFVELKYFGRSKQSSANANEPQSLFGPLLIFANFTGRAKTKIHKSNGNSSSTHRGRAPLFAQRHKIYDGPYNSKSLECVRFPFSFNFPECSQAMCEQGEFRPDPRFHSEAGGPLPPTFSIENIGFSKRFIAFVEYRIGASIRMPGIDIDINGLDRDENRAVVLYEQPPPPITATPKTKQIYNTTMIQNEFLMPEDQRPSGFREKAKFKFSSQEYPIYTFDIAATVPTEIYVGQPLTFEFSVHPNIERCTAPFPPSIKLQRFRAELKAHTTIRSEHGFFTSEEGNTSRNLPGVSTGVVAPDVPFCKANDHTKKVRTFDPIPNVQSTFSTYNISQQYILEIEYGIAVANKHVNFKRKLPVVIYGPVENAFAGQARYAPFNESGFAEASSSAAQGPANMPPLTVSSEHATALPEYERPPNYDQVLETTTENDVRYDSGLGNGKAVAR
jgi:hypothetical protein